MAHAQKAEQADRARQLIAGLKKHLPNATTLTFGSASYTPAQVEAFLQRIVDLRAAVEDARSATRAKVAAEKAQSASLRSQMAMFAAFVKASFTSSPDVLADFGLAPNKARTPLTVEQQATAAARRKATRAARHTMGKAQKKAVKGDVTGVVINPVAAPKSATTGANPASTGGVPQATTSPPQTGAPAAPLAGPTAGTGTAGH